MVTVKIKGGENVKQKIDYRIVVVALICIAVVECVALFKGMNGLMLTAVIGLMAGIAGITIPNPIKLK